jgi:predicted glycosyltransferase
MTRPRLLFYCQHSVGLGHLVRSVHLADGLAQDFDVTFLNGGPWPPDLPQPATLEIVHLPALGLAADYSLVSRDERFTVEAAVELRRSMVVQCFRDTAPDVVLIELFPFGRKKFASELMPLLEAARSAHPAPFVACSLRDILVGSRRDQQGHDDRASRVTNEYFDAVLVHADARFATLEETFHPTVPLRVPVHYTGFVRGPLDRERAPARQRERRVLVSAGGGMVGAPLFRVAAEAHPRLRDDLGLRTLIVTGPFLPEPDVDDLRRRAAETTGLEVVRYVPDLGAEMAASAVSLSQAGYNTTMDILGSGTPAVVVPYGEGREDEQAARARRLAGLGALRVLDADRLSARTFLDAVRDALDWTPLPVPLELDGRTRTSELLRTLRPARDVEAAP